jgi:hypothetical protein
VTDVPPSRSSTLGAIEKRLDSKTIEVLALTVFRTIFTEGIHVPLQMKGLMDMDLAVKDNNVFLNINKVQAGVPQLSVWRVTYAYQGKPFLEYGRGVKNDVKINYFRLAVVMMAMWRERSKKKRAEARGESVREQELVALSKSETIFPVAEDATA